MKKILLLALILLMLIAGGCWDWRILEDLSIIFGMGIDPVADDPQMFEITFVNPVFNPDAEEKRTTKTVRGYSLQQTLFNLQHQKDQQPALGKVAVIVFSEEMARGDGMQRFMTQFDQLRENSPMAWICIVREASAQKVLNLNLPEQPRAAVFLADLLSQNYSEGRTPKSIASRYWTRLVTPGITPLIPLIELSGPEGEEPNGILLAGLAVMDDAGRMRGSLSDSETLIYKMLAGEILRSRFYTQIDFRDQENRVVTAFIRKSSSRVQTEIKGDKAVIDIQAEIILSGLTADLILDSVLSEAVFRELEAALARDIQGNMLRVIKKTQEWESDIFGFGQLVRVQHSKWFDGRDWGGEYSESDIHVQVAVQIKRNGSMTRLTR